jgi:dolichyl-phosphate-mannose-protein mannosyltransferase
MADRDDRAGIAGTAVLAAIGVALEVTVAYRAATQSITYDEAATYLKFLRGPFANVFAYDASNHVLFTLLARTSIAVLGVSEFSLRLPSVVGAALFFAAVVLLCRRLFAGGLLAVLAMAVVAFDPFVLDFMSAARGYGLAFSLLTVAICCLTLALDQDRARLASRWAVASVALGLSVSAHLTFVFPALALAVTAALARATRDTLTRRSICECSWLIVPGVVVASTILAVPLHDVRPGVWYYGADRIARSVASVIQPAFDHATPAFACGAAGPGDRVSVLAAGVCLAAAVLVAVAVSVARRRGAGHQPAAPVLERFTLLCGGSLVLTLIQVVAIHAIFGFRYPEGRTGLYLVLLFPLAASGAVAVLLNSPATRMVGRGGALLLALTSLWFVSEFTVEYFYEWRFDAGSRRIVEKLSERSVRSGRRPRVWADDLEPSISFYRLVRRFDAIAPPLPDPRTSPMTSYDFFVACSTSERERTRRMGIDIYVDPVSAAVLVERH